MMRIGDVEIDDNWIIISKERIIKKTEHILYTKNNYAIYLKRAIFNLKNKIKDCEIKINLMNNELKRI